MKILQISPEGNIGSVGTIAEQIGLSLIENGHESFIAIGDYYLPSKSLTYKIGNVIDKYLHAIETRVFDRNGLGSRKASINLIKWIKKISPDLVHIHQFHGYYLNYDLLINFLIEYNIPVVFTLHDCWVFTGHCTYFESIDCNKWQTVCYNCELTNDYPKSLFVDNSYNNFIKKRDLFNKLDNLNLVSVSSWLESKVLKSFLKSKKSSVIYNGIDLNIFKKSDEVFNELLPSIPKNKFVILGVASPWNSRKGLEDFLSLSKLIDDRFIIILIGLSTAQISNLPHNIIGIEKIVDRSVIVKYYNLADVYVSFSKEETFGLTTVEAMACGTPPILYNSSASPEIVTLDTGFLVEKYNIKEVFRIIDFLQLNPNILNDFSENCVKRVHSKFNAIDRFNEYVQLFSQILKN